MTEKKMTINEARVDSFEGPGLLGSVRLEVKGRVHYEFLLLEVSGPCSNSRPS